MLVSLAELRVQEVSPVVLQARRHCARGNLMSSGTAINELGLIPEMLEWYYILHVLRLVAELVLLLGQSALAKRAELLSGLLHVIGELVDVLIGLVALQHYLVSGSSGPRGHGRPHSGILAQARAFLGFEPPRHRRRHQSRRTRRRRTDRERVKWRVNRGILRRTGLRRI